MLNREGSLYRTKHHFVGGLIMAIIVAACTVGYLIDTEKIEVRIAAIIFFIVCGANSLRFAFAGIRATAKGIYVTNIFSSYRLKWSDIHKFRIGSWNIFPYVCLIDLKDGGIKHAFGIQERTNFPNGSAEQMAEELNAELSQRRGGTSDGKAIPGPRPGSGESFASSQPIG
jgi:hypothetical protein